MPDQSSAATEHAILQEITAPLETLPDDPVAMVHADFPGALRGYDRPAVDAYVQRMSELVAELHATRSPEAAVRRALERVGEQISGILQRAHETSEQITAQSRREAEERLEQVRGEAAEIIETAEQRVRDLDADTDRIWIERGRIVDDARELARQLHSVVDTASERFADADPDAGPVEPYGDAEPSGEAEPSGSADPEPQAGAAELDQDDSAAVGATTFQRAFEDETTADQFREADTTADQFREADTTADQYREADTTADQLREDETTVQAVRPDDIGRTVRYDPLQPEPEPDPDELDDVPGGGVGGPARHDAPEPQVRGTRSSIPPASQAANRRQRD